MTRLTQTLGAAEFHARSILRLLWLHYEAWSRRQAIATANRELAQLDRDEKAIPILRRESINYRIQAQDDLAEILGEIEREKSANEFTQS